MNEQQIKILLVDDEKEFLDLLSKRLHKRSFTVSTVSSGQDALLWLEKNSVDIIILDIKMPKMDGIETLKEIKKHYPQIEVLLLTGHGSVEKGLQGMHHGAYDCMMKPFHIDDLVYKIQKAQERRQILLEKQ